MTALTIAALTAIGACGEQVSAPGGQTALQGRVAAPTNTCEGLARHPYEAGGDAGAVFSAGIDGKRVIELCERELATRANDPVILTRLARGYAVIGDNAKADALLAQADVQNYPIATLTLASRTSDLEVRRSLFMKARKQFWMDAQADKDGGLIGVAMTDGFDEYGRVETTGFKDRLRDAARAGYANTVYRAGIQLLTEAAASPGDPNSRTIHFLGSDMVGAAAAEGHPYAALMVAESYLEEAGVWSGSRNPEDQAGKWGGLRNAAATLGIARRGAAYDPELQAKIAALESQIKELRDKPSPQERDAQAVLSVLTAVVALAATWPSDPARASGQQTDYAKEEARKACAGHNALAQFDDDEAYQYTLALIAGDC